MSLASACAYPVDYFDDLAGLSDEDLEVERNDVRDILRALTGFQEKDGDCDATVSNEMSLQLLLKILQVCDQALDSARQKNEYFSESMVHAYSSLGEFPSCGSRGRNYCLLSRCLTFRSQTSWPTL